MRRIPFIALLLLTAGGCKHPTEVVVTPPVVPDERVEVKPVFAPDTSLYQNELDSVGVTPEDQRQYAGFFLLSSVTFDAGNGPVSRTLSKVTLIDRQRPFARDGRVFGWWGMDPRPAPLQLPTVNGTPLLPVPHRVRVGGMSLPWGVDFVRELSDGIRPDSACTWHLVDTLQRSSDFSIKAPPAVTVASPAGGAVLGRDQDLKLRWTAGAKVNIYVSAVDPFTRHARPLLQLIPAGTGGRAVLPARVLRTLFPPHDRYFVFTFVAANRMEQSIPLVRGPALVQAASVYNCYVEFR